MQSQGRTWADPRVHSPINRPALARRSHRHPDGVPRTDMPKERVAARLQLQQIHGVDEKRQYFGAFHTETDWACTTNDILCTKDG